MEITQSIIEKKDNIITKTVGQNLKNENGSYEKFPHIGGVEIHDDVEIGATNCIDRGTLQNTVIERGTKTDNLVHIAHNVHIGKNCLLTAGVTTSIK